MNLVYVVTCCHFLEYCKYSNI